MSDLRQRVPGHSLIEQLLREWDLGNIHAGSAPGEIVIDHEALGWYLGVHGERWVATRLAMLGPEYTVLHSVPIGNGNSDIDHVVIGPTGVFTINTKYSPGKDVWCAGWGVYVGGRPENHYIRNLDFEVQRAAQRLARASGAPQLNVTGLLVFVDPRHMSRKAPPGDGTRDLRVISDAELLDAISGPTVFTLAQVAKLSEAAARPETWHDAPHESTVGSHIALEFVALEEAVGPVAIPVKKPADKAPTAPRDTIWTAVAASKPRRPAAQRTGGRTRKRKKSSSLETIMASALFIGFGWWLLTWLSAQIGR